MTLYAPLNATPWAAAATTSGPSTPTTCAPGVLGVTGQVSGPRTTPPRVPECTCSAYDPARGSRGTAAGRVAHPNPSRRARARARARCARREGAGGARGAWVPPSHARIPRRARGAGARALTAPLHAPHGAAGGRSPKPSTPTPDCERDAHAGWVRGVGAIRGSRPRTRGAHVKRGAHGPAVYCVGSFHSPLQKLAASPAVSRRRARSCRPTEGRGRLGGRLRPLPRPARGRLGARRGASATRARPHTTWPTSRCTQRH